jgi:hypothetical protein
MNIEINYVIFRKFLSGFDIHVFRLKKKGNCRRYTNVFEETFLTVRSILRKLFLPVYKVLKEIYIGPWGGGGEGVGGFKPHLT